MRARAVGADAVHDDVDRIRAGIGRALRGIDLAGRAAGADVERERVVGGAETLPQFVVAHVARAEDALFGGLHDQHQRAAPLVLARRHLSCGTDETRDVHVVAAGMHDRHHVAGDRIALPRLRRIRQARFLFYRQAIHVRAHHHQRTVPVLEHGNDAGAAHLFRHVEAGGTQLLRHPLRRAEFHERQLGVAMKMIPETGQVVVVVLLDALGQLACRGSRRKHEKRAEQRGQNCLHGFPRIVPGDSVAQNAAEAAVRSCPAGG